MKIWVAKPSTRCKIMLNCFSDSLVEIDLSELAMQEPEFRGTPLWHLEKFIESKLEGK